MMRWERERKRERGREGEGVGEGKKGEKTEIKEHFGNLASIEVV